MANTFIKIPNRGDICVKEIATKKPMYIALDSYDGSVLDNTKYEVVGVVYHREGNNIGVVYKNNSSKKWCNRAWWYLSGYTLDGTSRTGTLSLRFASNSWASNIDKTISYNATTTSDFVTQLNTAFSADADMSGQDWYANVENDGRVRVHCNNISYQQCSSNTAKNGFALTTSLPEIKALANIRRKHGGKGGEGSVSNIARAVAYFTADLDAGTYNPTSVLTSIKTTYPVCLPAYLGTSAKVSGDKCAILRVTYGEGRDGWLKYMAAQRPVCPCDNGNMAFVDGSESTKVLASFKYTSSSHTSEAAMCAAADYCNSISSTTIESGEFFLPTTRDVYNILDGVTYGTNSSRNSDVLNKGLNKIGGSAISNGSYLWSCLRCGAGGAWHAYGYGGFFGSNLMCGACTCVPVSLYKIA